MPKDAGHVRRPCEGPLVQYIDVYDQEHSNPLMTLVMASASLVCRADAQVQIHPDSTYYFGKSCQAFSYFFTTEKGNPTVNVSRLQ